MRNEGTILLSRQDHVRTAVKCNIIRIPLKNIGDKKGNGKMTFEEKIEKAIESGEHKATDFAINYMSKHENNDEGFRRGALWAQKEVLKDIYKQAAENPTSWQNFRLKIIEQIMVAIAKKSKEINK
jgi:RNA polymerase-interacting CarD/CdnL/TRCF family regulator